MPEYKSNEAYYLTACPYRKNQSAAIGSLSCRNCPAFIDDNNNFVKCKIEEYNKSMEEIDECKSQEVNKASNKTN
jgi:hypothetical protein